MTKILVIEDQEMPRENLMISLVQDCNVLETDITHARWYREAEEQIKLSQYDIILLDHRMPENDPGCTDTSDFDRFCNQLENIGYGLLPMIQRQQPNAVVIGTSSLSSREIGQYTLPERRLDKTNIFEELPDLIRSVLENK